MKFGFHNFYSFCLVLYLIPCRISSTKDEQVVRGCNLFEGSWILDDNYPLYNSITCPFIDKEFDCQKNRRPDLEYQKYKWKPSSCTLPRFNGTNFLTRFQGKKILFVGDSLSLNQWLSLSCILHVAVPQVKYIKRPFSFSIPEYEIDISINTNHYLVDFVKEGDVNILDLDSVKQSSIRWKGYDVLIFNTFHWWFHTGQQWDYLRIKGKLIKDMNRIEAFQIALTTWAKWVNDSVNPTATKIIYQGISPSHYRAMEWKDSRLKTCQGQTKPINGSIYPGGPLSAESVVKKILSTISINVTFLDITTLSQLRVDGHPSIYGLESGVSDCSHWCLSGVPDAWNEILYALMIDQ